MSFVELKFHFKKEFPQAKISASGALRFGPENWTHAVMGPSGAGKTTWARWLAGLLPQEPGQLSFASEVWRDEVQSLPTQDRKVGFLAQGDYLFPHLNVEQNIAYGLRKLSAEERQSRAWEMMNLVGATDWALRNTKTLSGGQKRRVALAQVMAIRPRLLILDEPFTGLDEDSKNKLAMDLRKWLEQFRTPTILVTHQAFEGSALDAKIHHFVGGHLQV